MHHNVLPECYADTLLVELLGFKGAKHQLGIGQVFNTLKNHFSKQKAVGIIDDDKQKPVGIKDFEEVESKHKIQKLLSKDGKHTLLIIQPAFEDWVFANAAAVSIDIPTEFENKKRFRKICKDKNAAGNQALKNFLNTLKQKNAPGFVQLETWIEEGIL